MAFRGPYFLDSLDSGGDLDDTDKEVSVQVPDIRHPIMGNGIQFFTLSNLQKIRPQSVVCNSSIDTATFLGKLAPCSCRFIVNSGDKMEKCLFQRNNASLDLRTATLASEFSIHDVHDGKFFARLHSSVKCFLQFPQCSLQRIEINKNVDAIEDASFDVQHCISVPFFLEESSSSNGAVDEWDFQTFASDSNFPFDGVVCTFSSQNEQTQRTALTLSCYIWDDYRHAENFQGYSRKEMIDGTNLGMTTISTTMKDEKYIDFFVLTCTVIEDEGQGVKRTGLFDTAKATILSLLKKTKWPPGANLMDRHLLGKKIVHEVCDVHNKEWYGLWKRGDVSLIPPIDLLIGTNGPNSDRIVLIAHRLRLALYTVHCIWNAPWSIYGLRHTARPEMTEDDSSMVTQHLYWFWILPFLGALAPLAARELIKTEFENRMEGNGFTVENASALIMNAWELWLITRDTEWLKRDGRAIIAGSMEAMSFIMSNEGNDWAISYEDDKKRVYSILLIMRRAVNFYEEAFSMLNLTRSRGFDENYQHTKQLIDAELTRKEIEKEGMMIDGNQGDSFAWMNLYLRLYDRFSSDATKTLSIIQSAGLEKYQETLFLETIGRIKNETEQNVYSARDLMTIVWMSRILGEAGRRVSQLDSVIDLEGNHNNAIEDVMKIMGILGPLLDGTLGKSVSAPVQLLDPSDPSSSSGSGAKKRTGFDDPSAHSLFFMVFLFGLCGYKARGGIMSNLTRGGRASYGQFSEPRVRSGPSRALPDDLEKIDVVYQVLDNNKPKAERAVLRKRHFKRL